MVEPDRAATNFEAVEPVLPEEQNSVGSTETETGTFASESKVHFYVPHSDDHAGVIG
jgi:hypothetical protein